jgi:GTP cyclohydrolase FolE2
LFKKNTDPEKQDGAVGEKAEKLKSAKPERNTSLRRVGIEAERSRIVIRRKDGVRTLERGVETKVRLPIEQFT